MSPRLVCVQKVAERRPFVRLCSFTRLSLVLPAPGAHHTQLLTNPPASCYHKAAEQSGTAGEKRPSLPLTYAPEGRRFLRYEL